MIRATGDRKLDAKLRALRAALRGLDGTEGRPIARRNARRRALAALRGVRAAVDARWPAIVTGRAGVRRLKTFEGRLARLTDPPAGFRWVLQDDPAVVVQYAAAGVPVKRVTGTDRAGRTRAVTLVPEWADAIGPEDPGRLRAAKRSVIEKRAARAVAALKD